MLGMDELAVLEPEGRSPANTTNTKKRSTKTYSQATTLPAFMSPIYTEACLLNVTVDHILGGNNTVAFAVGFNDGTFPWFFYDACPQRLIIFPRLVASQCQFQLQLRRMNESQPLAIFITYNGESPSGTLSPPREDSDHSLPKIAMINSASKETDVLDLSIMPPMAIATTRYRRFSTFVSTGPGMGLIELERYGVRPVKTQPLDTLKQELKDFVISGKEKATSAAMKDGNASNILLHRQPHSQGFQYLLYLSAPIEKGQCTELIFPLVDSYLKSGVYLESQFEMRLLLEDALQLLCVDDLHSIADFIEKDVFALVDSQATLKPEDIQRVAETRRRMHWVSLRVQKAIDSPISVIDRMGRMYFGCLPLKETKSLPNDAVPTKDDVPVVAPVCRQAAESCFLAGCRAEVKKELIAALELDPTYGLMTCSPCPLIKHTFDSLSDEFLNFYCDFGRHFSVDDLFNAFSSQLKTLLSPKTPEIDARTLSCVGNDKENLISVLARLCETYQVSLGVSGDEFVTEGKEVGSLDVVVSAPTAAERSGDNECRSKLQTVSKFRTEGSLIDSAWYWQLQWSAVFGILKGIDSLLPADERILFLGANTFDDLKELCMSLTGLKELKDPVISLSGPLRIITSSGDMAPYEPHSFPLFLGIVWPALRNAHWRAEASENPSTGSLSFFAPTKEKQNSSANSRAKRMKRRAYIARECRELGLGDLTKLTKRLLVKVSSDAPTGAEDTKSAEAALQMFVDVIAKTLDKGDHHGVGVVRTVADAILECFKSVAPSLTSAELQAQDSNNPGGESSMDVFGADSLMRFLLILPALLRQCNLPLPVIRDCLDVVQYLLDFMTTAHKTLLDQLFQPPKEHYVKDEKPVLSGFAVKLRSVLEAENEAAPRENMNDLESQKAGIMTEVIRESEKDQLTTFLVRVLEQAIPCRATEMDCMKKNRRIYVGYPGFMCRHCLGCHGEGRYFFTTIESLTTASSVFERHVLKCPSVPADIKTAVITSKVDHTEERKHLPMGCQQAFFNHLWDRLRSSEIEGVLSRVYLQDSHPDASESDISDMSFGDHIAVLDYVRTSKQFSNDKSISDAMTLYYNCLEYGGRVCSTPAQPGHFSTEWLIRKIAPKIQWTTKKKARMLPG